MAIGERMYMARKLAGLSLRSLADQVGLSHTTIAKFEKGAEVPGSAVLLRVAAATGVSVEYFFRVAASIDLKPYYRKGHQLGQKAQARILSEVHEWLERYGEIESIFSEPRWGDGLPFVKAATIESLDDIESIADQLRLRWGLGSGPIDNLVEVLESHGIKIGLFNAPTGFDALSLKVDDVEVAMAAQTQVSGDRQRFSLAHELGHLVLPDSSDIDAESAAHRFAGAFLVPRAAAIRELGPVRHALSEKELASLKQEYGLSMAAWVHRAYDLHIINANQYRGMMIHFRQWGWSRCEPGEPILPETPQRFERLVYRAVSEELISRSRAAELLRVTVKQFRQPNLVIF